MFSQSLNGKYPKGHDGSGELSRKCLRREENPSDEESSSSDEMSSLDEDTSDEESSSEDASEDGLDEDDMSVVGEVLNQILNAPNAPADPAAGPAPQPQLDEAELEVVTNRVLDAFDPGNMGASIANVINLMEEAAGGHAPTLGALLGHVMSALSRGCYPEEFGVRNPAPPYSQLPGSGEVTMELAARLPEYVDYAPRYTREPMPPLREEWQGMRGQKRRREVDDDGEEDRDENGAENYHENEENNSD